jgi:hypothetical protein
MAVPYHVLFFVGGMGDEAGQELPQRSFLKLIHYPDA